MLQTGKPPGLRIAGSPLPQSGCESGKASSWTTFTELEPDDAQSKEALCFPYLLELNEDK